jgi:hypothetical protein
VDWIEQWFGLNPDGGDGSIEAMAIVGVIFVAAGIVTMVNRRLRWRVLDALGRLNEALARRRGPSA